MRGIIFSTSSVQDIIDDAKVQTRRVIKQQPSHWLNCIGGEPQPLRRGVYFANMTGKDDDPGKEINCPFGKPGDVLYVKEAWGIVDKGYVFKAAARAGIRVKWQSPRYMPRDAARIFIRIMSIRAEPLHAIKPADAQKEGSHVEQVVDRLWYNNGPLSNRTKKPSRAAWIEAFAETWDQINKSRGFAWSKNPYVWVLSFKRCRDTQGKR